ncbi:TlpA family protein disulfide reductase [Brachybacterium alimentarium]|uniref:TlpA family protein disulfide reductase n=1 Tax=Brachybacterium alimentarium TaxID=47845 RepID=UPI003FD03DBC
MTRTHSGRSRALPPHLPALPGTSARLTRRGLLGAAGTASVTLLLAACGSDTSDRYESGYVSGDGVATEIEAADRGEPLDFSGTTFEDEEFSSSDARGEVLVVNVWYASCPPCRKEAPDLQAIHEEYAEQGVGFVGVNVRDTAGPAKAFEERYGITYPSLPDPDAEIMYALRGQVSPNAVPSTLVLDGEGRVAARISGGIDPSTLRAMIDKVLGE